MLKLAADARPHALRSRKRGQFGELLHKDESLRDCLKQSRSMRPSQRRVPSHDSACGKQVKNVNTGRKTMVKETVTETRLNARGQRETGTDLRHEGVTEITAVLRPLLGLARVARPADMVAFIRDHVYKPEYKLETARGTAA